MRVAHDLGVVPRDPRIGDHQVVVERPADPHRSVRHGELPAVFEDQDQRLAVDRGTGRFAADLWQQLGRSERRDRPRGRADVWIGHPRVDPERPAPQTRVGDERHRDGADWDQPALVGESAQVPRDPRLQARLVAGQARRGRRGGARSRTRSAPRSPQDRPDAGSASRGRRPSRARSAEGAGETAPGSRLRPPARASSRIDRADQPPLHRRRRRVQSEVERPDL